MKIIGFTIDKKLITQVLISTLIGGLIGFGIALWRGNNLAIFLCAVAGGVTAIPRLRKQQKKQIQSKKP